MNIFIGQREFSSGFGFRNGDDEHILKPNETGGEGIIIKEILKVESDRDDSHKKGRPKKVMFRSDNLVYILSRIHPWLFTLSTQMGTGDWCPIQETWVPLPPSGVNNQR